jgi:hypothetical protein
MVMAVNNRRDVYLAKAREAEEMAAKFDDSYYRESWLNIAKAYRNLAREATPRDTPSSEE